MTSPFRFSGLPVTHEDTLFVFALEMEAAGEFDHVQKVFTGAGKVNAAYNLSKAIHQCRPQLIVNVGSAGSNYFKRGEIVCCTRFIQRDMDATGLGFRKYETPFSRLEPVLNYGLRIEGIPEGICGTGDNFDVSHLSTEYNLVDMEAYALASVAMAENIPFLCLKYISDGADGTAAEDWNTEVHYAAAAFKKMMFTAEI